MKFEDAYSEFKTYIRNRKKIESFNSLTSVFKARVLPYFEGRNLFDLTNKDILDWQLKIEELHFSNNYNKNCYYAFLSFLDYCVEYLEFPTNYLREVGKFRKHYEIKKSDFYTLKEFNCFIKSVDNEIYKQFFNFMFYCGTRPGETFALQFKDIQGNYVHITKTLTSHYGRNFDNPKTPSSFRKVRLDKKLKKDLMKLKQFYENCNDDYFIFGGKKPLAPTTVNRYKNKACKKSGIRPITLHQFRHSHATLLVNEGILINEVSKRLGHSEVSTTLDIYVHTDFSQEKRVIKTLNSVRNNFFNSLTSVFKNFISILKHISMF